MINCVYSDVEKVCIHPSKELFESGPMTCNPDECDYKFTFEQAEDYVTSSQDSQQIGTIESDTKRTQP